MARARNIKPKFFQNDELGELSPLARLLFIGLWTIADFNGCLEYRPKRIKAQILPYDECSVDGLVSDLDKSGFIAIYSVARQPYIKILKFKDHQNPHKNEREGGGACPDISEKDNEISELSEIEINRDKDGTDRAESLFPLPESLFLNPESGYRQPDEPPGEKTEKTAARPTGAVALSIAMRAAGMQTQPADPRLIALAAQGVEPETVTAACEEAKRAKPDERVGAGYVFAILERWSKDAAKLKVTGATAPKSTGGAWWVSDSAIIAKGLEMALQPTPGERMPDFKARIQAAIDNGGVPPAPPRMSLVGIAQAPVQPKSVMSEEMRATLKNLTGRSAPASKESA